MKVLIGIDESVQGDQAIEFVKRMAWPPGTRMVVASAVTVPMLTSADSYAPVAFDVTGLLGELTKIHRETASRQAKKLTDAGFTAESRVLDGDPRTALIEEARTEHADLLIVGSHGRTGIGKLVMGSVASHIVTHAPCSVVVVRAKGAA